MARGYGKLAESVCCAAKGGESGMDVIVRPHLDVRHVASGRLGYKGPAAYECGCPTLPHPGVQRAPSYASQLNPVPTVTFGIFRKSALACLARPAALGRCLACLLLRVWYRVPSLRA